MAVRTHTIHKYMHIPTYVCLHTQARARLALPLWAGPVVSSALGTVLAGIERCLNFIPGHHNLQHWQTTLLLGSARILRKHAVCPLSRAMWSKYLLLGPSWARHFPKTTLRYNLSILDNFLTSWQLSGCLSDQTRRACL